MFTVLQFQEIHKLLVD